ncbi:acyltransferase family protein [Bifidobacterium pseudolongum]|uniref:acyltransferase family protein n=2 Tax=Bifidobacterium pseudolongum TaxID=1694 RepID=UPI00052971EA|nr:acyltransferase family protein [Bifidobacterium pseudolongum]UNP91636.1 acyltransferase [Bifidobacterium pseudolongum subsp. pseudolongum]WCA40643.1 acyltransferase family protein [Bifidobacterium pseudolongum subsp. pseudolongum]
MPRIVVSGVPTTASRHIAVLDGMRALAIIGVIGYHTRPSLLPGGFLGVTLFFVVSGFLLTRSMVNLFERLRFSYPHFLRGRVRRLWPSVLATIAGTAILVYCMAPSLLPKVRGDALPSALFYSNWSFIFRKLSYFQAAGLPSPLTHLWFTSLIMQFYVLWPLLFVLIFQLCRSRVARAALIGALALASSLEMLLLYTPGQDTSRIYYGLDTRAAELLVGAALAVLLHRYAGRQDDEFAHDPPRWQFFSHTVHVHGRALRVTGKQLVNALGFALLVVFCVCFVTVDPQSAWLYRGGYLLFALLAAAMIWAGMHAGVFMRAMGAKLCSYIGSRSFSLYLVHYPLLIALNPATRTTPLPWWGHLGQFALIVAVGEVFFQLIEAMRGTPWLPWLTRTEHDADPARETAGERLGRRLAASGNTAVRALGTAGTRFATLTSRLRPGAVVGIVAGALAVLVLMLPFNWHAIAHARAVQLRPELALTAEEARKQLAKPAPSPTQSNPAQPRPQDTAQPQVSALIVPNNLDPSRWRCDAAAQQCGARMLMIGDSVTAAVAQTLQQHFPQAHIDGAVSRQFATGEDLLAQFLAGGEDPQVIVFALGTNGAATRDQAEHVVQLAAGRPLYFVTALAPVEWTAASNATFQEVAAAHPNVGIIDWSALATAHPEYLYDDGTHPNELGTQAYEQQLYGALCPHS